MTKYTHSCILLHGFTMKPNEMIYYSKYINRILPENVIMKYIYPKAPIRKITCYDGKKYSAWYDYYTNDKIVEEKINKKDLIESRNKIHKIIFKEKQYHNGDTSKIFIGGCSQGGCMALDTGISFPEKLGGIIGFKGHIINYTFNSIKINQKIWVCHGLKDNIIGYKVAKTSYDKYKKLGYDITFLSQKNVNHDINTGIYEQMRSLKNWLIFY